MESYRTKVSSHIGPVTGRHREFTGLLREKGELILSKEQQLFIEGINEIAKVLDSKKLERNSWMIIAGGGVFLYQLRHHGDSKPEYIDRNPTDLDIVVNNTATGGLILDLIKDAFAVPAVVNKEPVMHYGHVLEGPTLSTKTTNGLDVDIITELSQIYPKDHRFAPSVRYKYPSADTMLYQAKTYEHPLIQGKTKVAHPGFIAFYKLMLYRDLNGKQDTEDVRRLKALGLLNSSDELHEVLETMCHKDRTIFNALRKAIDEI
jgi:hypothetical protein